MRLTAFAILGLVASCSVLAAPAPPPRPWVDGWKVVDSDGDCKFVRKGDMLTIEVPGGNHVMDYDGKKMNAPCLLRPVEGDFVVQVRVRNVFEPHAEVKDRPLDAGLVLRLDGNDFIRLDRDAVAPVTSFHVSDKFWYGEDRIERVDSLADGKEILLRLERTGKCLRAAESTNGKDWHEMKKQDVQLPKKLKLGVFATSNFSGRFAPKFDKFKLTLKGPQGRAAARRTP